MAPEGSRERALPKLLCLTVLSAMVCAAPVTSSQGPERNPPAASPQSTAAALPPVQIFLREGMRLYDANQLELARQSFDRALVLARTERNTWAEAEAHRGLGLVLLEQASYPAARAEFEQALSLFQGLADNLGVARVHSHLARAAQYMGNTKEAEAFYRQALASYEVLGNRQGQANVLLSLTFLPQLGLEEQLRLLQQALGISRQIGDKGLEGRVLHALGDKYFTQGDFSAALEKLEQATACLEQAGDRDSLARVLTSLGRLHRAHGAYERALDFYRRALVIQEDVGDKQGVIQTLNAMAIAHSFLGQGEEELKLYQRALVLARETGSPRILGFILTGLANAYLEAGNFAGAAAAFEESLEQEPEPYSAAYRYAGLSDAYLKLGQSSRALAAAEKAVAQTKESWNQEYLPAAYDHRAHARQKLGDVSGALEDIQEALRVIEQIRTRLVGADFMKRGFSDRNQYLYSYAIELHEELGHQKQAFEVAEQARGRAFLDLLATRQVQAKPADRVELANLRKLEGDLRAKGVDPSAPSSGPSYDMNLRSAGSEVTSLWRQWRAANPELRSFVTAVPFSSGEMVATAARLRSTVLSYWVGKKATLIWVVKPDGSLNSVRVNATMERLAQLVKLTWAAAPASPADEVQPPDKRATPGAPDAAEHVRELHLRGGDVLLLEESQKNAWRELYRLLVLPVRHFLPKERGSLLTIVPHGPLFLLSFAALPDEKGRYLLESYRIHYTPAGAVLQFTEARKSALAGRPPRYLLVADPAGLPALPNGHFLPPLPGARREVAAVARSLPPGAVTLLVGGQAQEETVRASLRDNTVIHFATHGIVQDDQPLDSFLALGSGSSSAGSGDGRLTAEKIYALDLRADLVVLSACRSGLGKVTGDGIVGLTRAFLYAGTPSVVATLWDVADEPTRLLLPEFYRSLNQNPDKSRALRDAQLHLLRALRAGRVKVATPAGSVVLPEDPLFWAGFVLIGEP